MGSLIRDLNYVYSVLSTGVDEGLTILVLPLSWRHPGVVAPALAGSVWWHFWLIARFQTKAMRRADDLRRRQGQPTAPRTTFVLIDRDDPTPLVEALEDRDGRLRRVLVGSMMVGEGDFGRLAVRRAG